MSPITRTLSHLWNWDVVPQLPTSPHVPENEAVSPYYSHLLCIAPAWRSPLQATEDAQDTAEVMASRKTRESLSKHLPESYT